MKLLISSTQTVLAQPIFLSDFFAVLLFYNNVKSRFVGAEGHKNIMQGIQPISLQGLYMEEAREATLT